MNSTNTPGKVISDKPPTLEDKKQTQTIIDYLKRQHVFPTDEEEETRKRALEELASVLKDWVREVSLTKGFTLEAAETVNFRIETFGSYRLGVHSPTSDIDTLVVVPRHIQRMHFFRELYALLNAHSDVSDLISVSDAYVPVMKFRIFGIQIDLLIATVQKDNILDDFDISDDTLLINIDHETQRGLIGPRVAKNILSLVPNIENYRVTLRCVKYFAQRRGIYGAALGYLGGVSYAILVGMICQCYPNASPNVLLSRFFNMYSQWKWSYRAPVIMQTPEATIANPVIGYTVWNPQHNIRDRNVLMPIITPAFPATNCTFNVTNTTFRIIKAEIDWGNAVSFDALLGRRDWSELFEEVDFFVRYQNYLQIEISAENETDFRIWSSFVESRLRYLIQKLEAVSPQLQVHPFPSSFLISENHCILFYIGLNYARQRSGACEIDLTSPVEEFEQQLCEWIGWRPTMHRPYIQPIRREEIPDFVFPVARRRQLLTARRQLKKRKSTDNFSKADTPPTKKLRSNDLNYFNNNNDI